MDSKPAVQEIPARDDADDIDLAQLPLIDFSRAVYEFEATGYKVSDDHTEFIFKVTAPNGAVFSICDRYSSIRSFYEVVKKYIGDDAKTLPKFPPKKMFGTKNVGFVVQRQRELLAFFQAFMQLPQVGRNQFVITYFESHPLDDQSFKIIKAINKQFNDQKKSTLGDDQMPDFSDLRSKIENNRRFSLYD